MACMTQAQLGWEERNWGKRPQDGLGRHHIPESNKRQEQMHWRNAADADWEMLGYEIEEPLRAWHRLYETATAGWEEGGSGEREAAETLTEATAMFGAITLVTMWRANSPYGKFSKGRGGGGGNAWWNRTCTEAMQRHRESKGKANEEQSRPCYAEQWKKQEGNPARKWLARLNK